MILDTGCPVCNFDHSLEPKLGERLRSANVRMLDAGTNSTGGVYAAPRLYLGSTPLAARICAFTWDLKPLSDRLGRPILGILGMDVLRHYCIQLDFEADKLRFLDSRLIDPAKLGKAFPLIFSSENQSRPDSVCPFIRHGTLIEEPAGRTEIDTGCKRHSYRASRSCAARLSTSKVASMLNLLAQMSRRVLSA